jgi:hypothetical protein
LPPKVKVKDACGVARAMAQAPPLSAIFPGKIIGAYQEGGLSFASRRMIQDMDGGAIRTLRNRLVAAYRYRPATYRQAWLASAAWLLPGIAILYAGTGLGALALGTPLPPPAIGLGLAAWSCLVGGLRWSYTILRARRRELPSAVPADLAG